MNYQDKHFLVTGGAGLIGSHICDELVAKGAGEVRVLDNFSRGRRENLADACAKGYVRIIEGDVRKPDMVNYAMQGIDYVFDEAALRIAQCAEERRLCYETMMTGTFNILEAAREWGVEKLIFASSASVYGEPSYLPMDETHPFNNDTLYGAAKIAAEQMLASYHKMFGLNYVALRYFNTYGPRMDILGIYTEVMVRWMQAITSGKPPVIFGDGKTSMDLVYVGDVARANILALEAPVTADVFNIATGVETTLDDLAKLLLELMGSSLGSTHKPVVQVNPVTHRRADITKARMRLGFDPQVDVREGLKQLIDWWRERKGYECQ